MTGTPSYRRRERPKQTGIGALYLGSTDVRRHSR